MGELLLARGTVIEGTGALIRVVEKGNIRAVKFLLEYERRLETWHWSLLRTGVAITTGNLMINDQHYIRLQRTCT